MIPVLEVAPMVPSFSKESWTSKRIVDSLIKKYLQFLFLDKSQVQKSVEVITCFSCTVKKQLQKHPGS